MLRRVSNIKIFGVSPFMMNILFMFEIIIALATNSHLVVIRLKVNKKHVFIIPLTFHCDSKAVHISRILYSFKEYCRGVITTSRKNEISESDVRVIFV